MKRSVGGLAVVLMAVLALAPAYAQQKAPKGTEGPDVWKKNPWHLSAISDTGSSTSTGARVRIVSLRWFHCPSSRCTGSSPHCLGGPRNALSESRFAARATHHDAGDAFHQNYAAQSSARLYSAGVPARLGGGGGAFPEAVYISSADSR
jgi:hypothetical protein